MQKYILNKTTKLRTNYSSIKGFLILTRFQSIDINDFTLIFKLAKENLFFPFIAHNISN